MKNQLKLLSVIFLSISFITNLAIADTLKKVAITQIVAHPTLDKVRSGIIDGLKEANFINNQSIKIDYQNANGNIVLANQIAKKFVSENSDIIIAITTPSAQAAANAAKATHIPVVFATVTDPVKAKLVVSLNHPGGNITGTNNPSAIKEQIQLVQQFIPGIKNLGLIINFSEVNSVELMNQVKQETKKLGINLITTSVTSSADVSLAAKGLVSKVQAIFLLQDNTVASALPALMKVMDQNHIPVFASFAEAVDQGAVAALAYDEYQIGVQTGKIAAKILNGETPENIPVETPKQLDLIVNKEVAAKLGIKP
jgi:putative ABC transport system substrate-binding protein